MDDPLKNLVIFMICLALPDTVVAGLHYVVIDQPTQQAALHAPGNDGDSYLEYIQKCLTNFPFNKDAYNLCMKGCPV